MDIVAVVMTYGADVGGMLASLVALTALCLQLHRPRGKHHKHAPLLDPVAEAPQLGDQEPGRPHPSGASIETVMLEVIPIERLFIWP